MKNLREWILLLCLAALLAAAGCVPLPTATPTSTNAITGIVWQWTSVANRTTKETVTVAMQENCTIIFNADGALMGKADCNTFTCDSETKPARQ